ncbi:hypothetical protein BGZ47_004736 [Haplosporangium gracile]|nr:hypothetical protein BGZ47_004736 [Haplosporangium gracile]
MVSKQLQHRNFYEEIQELKLHRQLVLICDGYDESQPLVNLHKTNFFNQAGQWNTKWSSPAGLIKNLFLLTIALNDLPKLVGSQQDLSSQVTRLVHYDTFVGQWLETNKLRIQTNTLSKEEQDVLETLLDDGFVANGINF